MVEDVALLEVQTPVARLEHGSLWPPFLGGEVSSLMVSVVKWEDTDVGEYTPCGSSPMKIEWTLS